EGHTPRLLTVHIFNIWVFTFAADKNRTMAFHLQEKYVNPFTDFGFKKLFEAAELAKLTPAEMFGYEQSLKYYRDMKNVIDTSYGEGLAEGRVEGLAEGRAEGLAEGRAEGKLEIARKALLQGLSVSQISVLTGLAEAEIEQLRKQQ
ncbi:MAG: hypothetical protein ACKVU2_18355, partial [Saprospiraceae bacterium]